MIPPSPLLLWFSWNHHSSLSSALSVSLYPTSPSVHSTASIAYLPSFSTPSPSPSLYLSSLSFTFLSLLSLPYSPPLSLSLSLLSSHNTATMRLGDFHTAFLEEFTPVVIQYLEGLETSMREDLARSFAQEEWLPVR